MRIAELLALLGRSWSRLFLYPGGLALVAALLLLRTVLGKPAAQGAEQRAYQQDTLLAPASPLHFLYYASFVILPWLGLALLPLPFAADIGRSLDLVIALALLEWPRLLLAAHEYRSGQHTRLAAVLNSYPPLIAAIVLLAAPTGSFESALLMQAPAATTPMFASLAHWSGAVGFILTLPVLLGLGPFSCPAPAAWPLRIGLLLRGIGIVVLAAMPAAGLIPEDASWALPLPVGGVALIAWGMHRFGLGRPALPWARALLWLVLLEVGIAVVAGRW